MVLKQYIDNRKGLNDMCPGYYDVTEAIELVHALMSDNLPKLKDFKRGDILKCETSDITVVFDHFETVSYPKDSFRAIWDSIRGFEKTESTLWNSAVFRLATEDERIAAGTKMAKMTKTA